MSKFSGIGLLLAATLLSVDAAWADPIRVVFQGSARQAGLIRYEMEPATGMAGFDLPITSGENASAAAATLANGINNTSFNQQYDATTTTNNSTGAVTVTITPKAGVDNFTKIKRIESNGTDRKESGMNSVGVLLRAAPGRSELEFVPSFELADPTVDWHIQVFDQQEEITAQSDLLNVSPSTTAADLATYFAQSLAAQGIPVIATGDTLSMETNDNLMLSALLDGSSSWEAITTNQAIPEPCGLCVMTIGALLSAAGRRRRHVACEK